MPTPITLPSAGSRDAGGPAPDCWPTGLLEAFTLRMSSHGHCVSGCMMMVDSSYAAQQLIHARCLPDDQLRGMATTLFGQLAVLQAPPLAN